MSIASSARHGESRLVQCPVLSGPTDLPEETDVSTGSNKTCEQTPSCPDQTSAAPQFPAASQQDQTSESDFHPLAPRQLQIIDKDDSIPLTSALRETFIDQLTHDPITDEHPDLQQQANPAILPAELPAAV